MSNAGGRPPPTTPLYRPQAGGPAPAIQRSSPENSPATQRSSPKKSQGIQRKLIRHKRPHRRTTARFAARRLLSTRPTAAPERARGEVAGPRSETPMRVASTPADAFGQGILSSRHAQANHGLKRGNCCNTASAGGEGLRQRGVAKASSTILGRRSGAD